MPSNKMTSLVKVITVYFVKSWSHTW